MRCTITAGATGWRPSAWVVATQWRWWWSGCKKGFDRIDRISRISNCGTRSSSLNPVHPVNPVHFSVGTMAKPRKSPGRIRVPSAVLAELNAGTRESANLMEGLAVDFAALMAAAIPHVPADVRARLTFGKPSITARMRIAGEILLEHIGLGELEP